jgi:hypothetical protein
VKSVPVKATRSPSWAKTATKALPASETPYGGTAGASWAGPHVTLKAALTEWIKRGTFNGTASGRFIVDASGVASPGP